MMHLADPNSMDTDGGVGGGAGGMGVSQGHQLAAHGFYAAMSPVTVAPGRGGFPGGRRHQRHHSGGNHHGSGGGGAVAEGGQLRGSQGWRMGEVSPEEAAVLRGDSPSSARGGGGGGMGMGGLGLTAHAMSRMEQVRFTTCVVKSFARWWAVAQCTIIVGAVHMCALRETNAEILFAF